MRDCYVDELFDGALRTGFRVFQLNYFEIDRETFKLAQEVTLLQLTEGRLDGDYVQRLIIEPLDAAVELALSDRDAAGEEVRALESAWQVGEATRSDVAQAQARHAERRVIADKARIDRDQKRIEIQSQTRQAKAARNDLEERIALNMKIRDLHSYVSPVDGIVIPHTYSGAFVEEGDPICTLET